MATDGNNNVIEFRHKPETESDPGLLTESEETMLNVVTNLQQEVLTCSIDEEGWIYPRPDAAPGVVLELFPGCVKAHEFESWEVLDPHFLAGESRAMQIRRERALNFLKKRYAHHPKKLAAVLELEAINNELAQGVFDIVKAEAAHHRKYGLVVQHGLPISYLRIDNSSWGIQSVNHMVIAMGIASNKAGENSPLLQEITPERLDDFQRLKNQIFAELQRSESELIEECRTSRRTLGENVRRWISTVQLGIGLLAGKVIRHRSKPRTR